MRKTAIVLILSMLLIAADTGFMTIVEYLDATIEGNFSHSMLLFGALLGVLYLLLEVFAVLYRGNYAKDWVAIFPSLFIVNGFLWYLYIFVNKLFSDNQEDNKYFQAVMIAFSVFFLLVNIGKELKVIHKKWNKDRDKEK